MRILLQFPEGLKQKALEHAKLLESEGNEVIISASPTFGACDLAIDEAKIIKADKLVHFGHAEFHHVDFNVEYIPYYVEAPLDVLTLSLTKLTGYKKIGLVTTIQHIKQLDKIKEFYEKNGKEVIIGKPYGFAKVPGQVLGCDVGSASTIDKNVEVFVYFGGGLFHPVGALLCTTKPFLILDPFQNRAEFIDHYREEARKRSRGKIIRALEAKNFGILVSTKNGQHNLNMAKILKNKIESKQGLKAAILVSNTFDFDSLNNMMEFDIFVNTSCPRLTTDDNERLRKPLLSANELIEALNQK